MKASPNEAKPAASACSASADRVPSFQGNPLGAITCPPRYGPHSSVPQTDGKDRCVSRQARMGGAWRRSSGLSCFNRLPRQRQSLLQSRHRLAVPTDPMKRSLTLPFVRLLSSSQGNAWRRRLQMAAGALLLVWLALWLAVPPLVHARAQQALSDLLGRQVTMGRLQFLPWSLEITLQDLSVAGRDGAAPQLQVARIHVDLEMQSLLRRAPVIDALEVDAPILRVTQLAPGQTDLDDVVHRLNQPGPEGSQPQGFALYNIALQGGAIDFVDRTVGQTHEVRDIAFSLPFLSNL